MPPCPYDQVLASGGVEDRVRLWDVGSVLQRSELLRQDAGAGAWTARAGGAGAGGGGVAAAVMEDDEATSAGQVPAPGAELWPMGNGISANCDVMLHRQTDHGMQVVEHCVQAPLPV